MGSVSSRRSLKSTRIDWAKNVGGCKGGFPETDTKEVAPGQQETDERHVQMRQITRMGTEIVL